MYLSQLRKTLQIHLLYLRFVKHVSMFTKNPTLGQK
jgi:hypothetical protein